MILIIITSTTIIVIIIVIIIMMIIIIIIIIIIIAWYWSTGWASGRGLLCLMVRLGSFALVGGLPRDGVSIKILVIVAPH